MSVYNGLVNSLLCYCICCWGSACCYLVDGVIVLQKRILRLINHVPARTPSRPYFLKAKILTCRQTFVYRCLTVLRRVFVVGAVDSRKFLRIPMHRTERRKKSFSIISRIIFNNLPSELRTNISLSGWRDWILDLINVDVVLKPRLAV